MRGLEEFVAGCSDLAAEAGQTELLTAFNRTADYRTARPLVAPGGGDEKDTPTRCTEAREGGAPWGAGWGYGRRQLTRRSPVTSELLEAPLRRIQSAGPKGRATVCCENGRHTRRESTLKNRAD